MAREQRYLNTIENADKVVREISESLNKPVNAHGIKQVINIIEKEILKVEHSRKELAEDEEITETATKTKLDGELSRVATSLRSTLATFETKEKVKTQTVEEKGTKFLNARKKKGFDKNEDNSMKRREHIQDMHKHRGEFKQAIARLEQLKEEGNEIGVTIGKIIAHEKEIKPNVKKERELMREEVRQWKEQLDLVKQGKLREAPERPFLRMKKVNGEIVYLTETRTYFDSPFEKSQERGELVKDQLIRLYNNAYGADGQSIKYGHTTDKNNKPVNAKDDQEYLHTGVLVDYINMLKYYSKERYEEETDINIRYSDWKSSVEAVIPPAKTMLENPAAHSLAEWESLRDNMKELIESWPKLEDDIHKALKEAHPELNKEFKNTDDATILNLIENKGLGIKLSQTLRDDLKGKIPEALVAELKKLFDEVYKIVKVIKKIEELRKEIFEKHKKAVDELESSKNSAEEKIAEALKLIATLKEADKGKLERVKDRLKKAIKVAKALWTEIEEYNHHSIEGISAFTPEEINNMLNALHKASKAARSMFSEIDEVIKKIKSVIELKIEQFANEADELLKKTKSGLESDSDYKVELNSWKERLKQIEYYHKQGKHIQDELKGFLPELDKIINSKDTPDNLRSNAEIIKAREYFKNELYHDIQSRIESLELIKKEIRTHIENGLRTKNEAVIAEFIKVLNDETTDTRENLKKTTDWSKVALDEIKYIITELGSDAKEILQPLENRVTAVRDCLEETFKIISEVDNVMGSEHITDFNFKVLIEKIRSMSDAKLTKPKEGELPDTRTAEEIRRRLVTRTQYIQVETQKKLGLNKKLEPSYEYKLEAKVDGFVERLFKLFNKAESSNHKGLKRTNSTFAFGEIIEAINKEELVGIRLIPWVITAKDATEVLLPKLVEALHICIEEKNTRRTLNEHLVKYGFYTSTEYNPDERVLELGFNESEDNVLAQFIRQGRLAIGNLEHVEEDRVKELTKSYKDYLSWLRNDMSKLYLKTQKELFEDAKDKLFTNPRIEKALGKFETNFDVLEFTLHYLDECNKTLHEEGFEKTKVFEFFHHIETLVVYGNKLIESFDKNKQKFSPTQMKHWTARIETAKKEILNKRNDIAKLIGKDKSLMSLWLSDSTFKRMKANLGKEPEKVAPESRDLVVEHEKLLRERQEEEDRIAKEVPELKGLEPVEGAAEEIQNFTTAIFEAHQIMSLSATRIEERRFDTKSPVHRVKELKEIIKLLLQHLTTYASGVPLTDSDIKDRDELMHLAKGLYTRLQVRTHKHALFGNNSEFEWPHKSLAIIVEDRIKELEKFRTSTIAIPKTQKDNVTNFVKNQIKENTELLANIQVENRRFKSSLFNVETEIKKINSELNSIVKQAVKKVMPGNSKKKLDDAFNLSLRTIIHELTNYTKEYTLEELNIKNEELAHKRTDVYITFYKFSGSADKLLEMRWDSGIKILTVEPEINKLLGEIETARLNEANKALKKKPIETTEISEEYDTRLKQFQNKYKKEEFAKGKDKGWNRKPEEEEKIIQGSLKDIYKKMKKASQYSGEPEKGAFKEGEDPTLATLAITSAVGAQLLGTAVSKIDWTTLGLRKAPVSLQRDWKLMNKSLNLVASLNKTYTDFSSDNQEGFASQMNAKDIEILNQSTDIIILRDSKNFETIQEMDNEEFLEPIDAIKSIFESRLVEVDLILKYLNHFEPEKIKTLKAELSTVKESLFKWDESFNPNYNRIKTRLREALIASQQANILRIEHDASAEGLSTPYPNELFDYLKSIKLRVAWFIKKVPEIVQDYTLALETFATQRLRIYSELAMISQASSTFKELWYDFLLMSVPNYQVNHQLAIAMNEALKEILKESKIKDYKLKEPIIPDSYKERIKSWKELKNKRLNANAKIDREVALDLFEKENAKKRNPVVDSAKEKDRKRKAIRPKVKLSKEELDRIESEKENLEKELQEKRDKLVDLAYEIVNTMKGESSDNILKKLNKAGIPRVIQKEVIYSVNTKGPDDKVNPLALEKNRINKNKRINNPKF